MRFLIASYPVKRSVSEGLGAEEHHSSYTHLLVGEIFLNRGFQPLPNLLARHGLEVGRGKDAINNARVLCLLLGAYYRESACQLAMRTGVTVRGVDMMNMSYKASMEEGG